MTLSNKSLSCGVTIRPASSADRTFLETLYHGTREDLRLADAEPEFIDNLINIQFNAQQAGYGEMFPNAMYFVVEKLHELIGRITVDFGSNEIRVIDIAFIPQARGKGFGEIVLRAMQKAAAEARAPLTLTVQPTNFFAKRLYHKLGFHILRAAPMAEQLIWYPGETG